MPNNYTLVCHIMSQLTTGLSFGQEAESSSVAILVSCWPVAIISSHSLRKEDSMAGRRSALALPSSFPWAKSSMIAE